MANNKAQLKKMYNDSRNQLMAADSIQKLHKYLDTRCEAAAKDRKRFTDIFYSEQIPTGGSISDYDKDAIIAYLKKKGTVTVGARSFKVDWVT